MKQIIATIKYGNREGGYTVAIPEKPTTLAILDLHGLGERSWASEAYNTAQVKEQVQKNLINKTGLPYLIGKGLNIDFIVISPQMWGSGWWDIGFINTVVDKCKSEYGITHLAGHGISAGGQGILKYAEAYPNELIATVSNVGVKSGNPAKRKNIPHWDLSCSGDSTVNALSNGLAYVRDLNNAGGKAYYTYFKGFGHWDTFWNNTLNGTIKGTQLESSISTGKKEYIPGHFPIGDWFKSILTAKEEPVPVPDPEPPQEEPKPTTMKKIKLHKDNIIPLGYTGKDFTMLVDEQDAIDDEGNLLYTPKNPAFSGWKEWAKDQVYIYDFRGDKWIDRIITFDGSGEIGVKVEFGVTPYQFSKQITFDGKDWNKLVSKQVGVLARYMRISFTGNVGPVEFWAIGEDRGEEEPKPERIIRERPTIKDFLGVNSYVWNPVGTVEPFKHIRQYSLPDANHIRDAEGNQFMQFTNVIGSSSDYDHYYKTHHDAGKRMMICFTGSPQWIGDTYPADAGWKDDAIPVKYGDDPSNPASYSELIFRLKQTMMRYASVKHPDEALKVNRGKVYNNQQAVFSGAGWMMEYEVGNELEKDWSNSLFYQKPYNMAIMLNECCKARDEVDKDAWIVIPGMTWLNIPYLKAVKLKLLELNNGKIPENLAVNVHHYCSDAGAHITGNSKAVCPEENDFYGRVAELMEYVETEWNRPCYMSEWGYDVGTSQNGVPEIPGKTREETQADWLIRGTLEAKAAGIDRLHIYIIQDWAHIDEKYNPALFQTTGVRYKDPKMANAGEPKPSYHRYAELIDKYGDCQITSREVIEHEGRKIYKHTLQAGDGATTYAIWLGSGKGDSVKFENRTITESPLFYTNEMEPEQKAPIITGSHKNPAIMFASNPTEKSPVGHYDIGWKNVDWFAEIEFPVAIHVSAINWFDAHGDGKAYIKLSEDGTNYGEPIELDLGQYLKWRSTKTAAKVKKAKVYGSTTVVPVRVHFDSDGEDIPTPPKIYNLKITGATEDEKKLILGLVGDKMTVI